MGFSHSELFQDKEYLEAIHMVMDLKGIVPVVGTVLCKVNTEECTMEEKWYSATSGLLSMLPKFGGLKRLEKKVSIAINSRKENIKVIGALNKARNMELLFGMFYGNAKTGAKVLEKPRNEYLQKMLSDIKNKAKREKRKEYIAKNKGKVHNPDEWIEMRVCTDGKPTNVMKANKFYEDKKYHQDSTSLFGEDISADKIPYIVLPLIEEEDENKRKKKKEEKKEEEDMSIYKYSVGVIIDEEGNYLYCVAAESGPKANGMGEMSIYAAWRMKKFKIYFDVDSEKPEILSNKYIIGDDSKDKGKKYKFILFSKSAPAPEKTRAGWYKNQKKLYKQIIEEGKKCYIGTGRCLN